jgi:hypothetical protein
MSGEAWRNLFETWPEAIPRRGLVITTWGEAISFVSYLLSGGILLLERDRPDTAGARKVMLSWDAISAVKITDVIDLNRFQVMGFQPPM